MAEFEKDEYKFPDEVEDKKMSAEEDDEEIL